MNPNQQFTPTTDHVSSDDSRTVLMRELTATQVEIWLLEERARLVRVQLANCRARRTGLGCEYRRQMLARAS